MSDSAATQVFRRSLHRFAAHPLGVFALVMVLIFAAVGPRYRVGDGFEYWGMLINLAEFGRPYSTRASNASFLEFQSKHQDIFGKPVDLRQWFERLTLPNGQTDFNHFWFYSLLAVPFFWGVRAFGLHPSLTFTLLHLALFYAALTITTRNFGRSGGLTLVILTFFSPVANYLNVAHTEFFTVQICFIAVVCLLRGKWLYSALAFAVLTLQNPAFGPVAVFLAGYELTTVLSRRRREMWKLNYVSQWLLLAAVLVAHPAYYYSRWSTLTPQLRAGGITHEATSAKRMLVWVFDPDIGLLPNWPLGLCIVAAAVLMCFGMSGNRSTRTRYRLTWARWPQLAALLVCAVIIAYAHSKTEHLNTASLGSAARYSLWYIPLFFPVLYPLLHFREGGNWAPRAARTLVALGMLGSAVLIWRQDSEADYCKPSPFAAFFYRHFPTLYDPPAEIYIERYSGLGESSANGQCWAVSNREGTKILVRPELLPTSSTDAIPAMAGYRGRLKGSVLLLNQASYRPHPVNQSASFLHPSAEQLTALKWAPALSVGDTISGAATYDDFFCGDWSWPEEDRRWTTGPDAAISFHLTSNASDFLLDFDGTTFVPRKRFPQTFIFHFNEHSLGTFTIKDADAHRFTFKIRSDMLRQTNELTIRAKTPHSPRATGDSADGRLLGWYFHHLTIRSP